MHILAPRLSLFAALALAIVCPVSATAQSADTADANVPPPPEGSVGGLGDINLFPKRVVIDGRRSISQIGIYNKTSNSGDYAIDILDMAMTPDGNLVAFDKDLTDEQKARVATASPFLRYSPRRVTLSGGDSQLIRIMARADAELPDGEYRSHFRVSAIPPDEGGTSIEGALGGEESTGIGVTIRPRFGISIPIIVRIGATTLDVGIDSVRLVTTTDGRQALAMNVTRSGTRSAFGDVIVTASGGGKPVAVARGVGIYPEIDQRLVVVPINPEAAPESLASGTRWTVSFVDDDFEPGKTLAEIAFMVP